MNPKQKLIQLIFGPAIDFFENTLKISGGFVAFIFVLIIAILMFRSKIRSDMDILRRVLIVIALVLGLVVSIIETLKIRG